MLHSHVILTLYTIPNIHLHTWWCCGTFISASSISLPLIAGFEVWKANVKPSAPASIHAWLGDHGGLTMSYWPFASTGSAFWRLSLYASDLRANPSCNPSLHIPLMNCWQTRPLLALGTQWSNSWQIAFFCPCGQCTILTLPSCLS